jgi:hypothetical protein
MVGKVTKKETESEYDYLMSIDDSLGKYVGFWIAIVDSNFLLEHHISYKNDYKEALVQLRLIMFRLSQL